MSSRVETKVAIRWRIQSIGIVSADGEPGITDPENPATLGLAQGEL